METVKLLTNARAQITEKEHWTTEVYCRDIDGKPSAGTLMPHHSFCAIGALLVAAGDNIVARITEDEISKPALEFIHEAADFIFESSIIYVNDSLGHDAVLEVYDLAIELAKESSNQQ